ncbi:MAG TPA: ornithine cyclodeaminase family protein [Actinomycetota bacterium]|nr:ornithine cyclodeaminase family protein [Actinomycetota bacterium]
MSSLPVIDAERLGALVPMQEAVDALEEAFGLGRVPKAPLRMRLETDAGTLLAMPATGPQGSGVKLVTLTPSNPGRGLPLIHGLYVLFAGDSQRPEAAIDGAALTALRTGAVSALATRYLARPEASRLVLFGAGIQGRAHLEAMRAVRPVERVVVVSRSAGRAEELVGTARALGLDARVGDPGAVAEADLVCTCTTSPTPVFEGGRLADGAHVNAVGAYTPDTRELDDEAIRRARVVVETREAALAEAGDLLIPMEAGLIPPDHVVADLAELVGGAEVRRDSSDVTVFKSVGVAFEDLVIARAVVDRLVRPPDAGAPSGPGR